MLAPVSRYGEMEAKTVLSRDEPEEGRLVSLILSLEIGMYRVLGRVQHTGSS